MLIKVPSSDWSEQLDCIVEEEESFSDFEEDPDFSEYMWMENEEEFDRNELARLEEEHLMNECMEAMMEDELISELTKSKEFCDEHETDISNWTEFCDPPRNKLDQNNSTVLTLNVLPSVLNPNAKEFVPQTQLN
ncbi:polyadenylate-binding protein-interacting protein 2 [Teleopsis dalmanni]|uniref:polyadenylate-binding protein-interacting protein 2 n=1 Tax=Teleopsis dalmanni TaxID=139649 RepID=UPI0018CDFA8D|nr:polyadenylate-binding protein-interacting protein 2 [Teleopsis dalmanni]